MGDPVLARDPDGAVAIFEEAVLVGGVGGETGGEGEVNPVVRLHMDSVGDVHAVGSAAPDPAARVALDEVGVLRAVARAGGELRDLPDLSALLQPAEGTGTPVGDPDVFGILAIGKGEGTDSVDRAIGWDLVPNSVLVEPDNAVPIADPRPAGRIGLQVHRMIIEFVLVAGEILTAQAQRAGLPFQAEEAQFVAHPDAPGSVLEDGAIFVERAQRIGGPLDHLPSGESRATPNLRMEASRLPPGSGSSAE